MCLLRNNFLFLYDITTLVSFCSLVVVPNYRPRWHNAHILFFFFHFLQVKNICRTYFLLQKNGVLQAFFSAPPRMLHMLHAVYSLPLGYTCILVSIPMCCTSEFKQEMTLRLGNQEVLRRANRLVSFETTRTTQKNKNIMEDGHRQTNTQTTRWCHKCP